MFCLWEKFSQRVNGSATFRAVCILQIFYVYNALHGATLAKCSHFQYVSRWRLRVIWISVKTCIDATLYDEPFVTSIIEKHILIPLRIILTAVQWSTLRSKLYSFVKLRARYTIGLVHSIAYFIEPMTEAYGMTFHSLSIFCHGRVLSLTQLHTFASQARTPSLTVPFWTISKNLSRYVLIWKNLIKRLDLSI